MFWLVLAATAAQADPPKPAAIPLRQAKATVRIVRAEPVRFEMIKRDTPEALRKTVVRSPNGEAQEADLLEFE